MIEDPCSKYETGSGALRACRQGQTHYEKQNHRVEVTSPHRKLLIHGALIGLGILVLIVILNFITGKDVSVLAVTSFTMALVVLYYFKRNRELLIAIGLLSCTVDFLYEKIGISNGSWDYATAFRLWDVPILLIVVYFSLGVLVTALIKIIDPYLD